jgi:PAS domain S-box-containing protein
MKNESKRLNLSHKDTPSTKSVTNPSQEMTGKPSKNHGKPDQIKQYVNELLEFLGQINWEVNGTNQDKVRDPDHPFGPVFDAIELIKSELDDRNRQHKRVEQESRQSEEQFRRIVESSPMGIHMYRLESDGRLVFTGANPAADIILGIDNKQFVGKTIEEAFPALVKTEVPNQYRQVCVRGNHRKTEQIDYRDEQIQGAFEVHAFQTSPNNMAAMFFDTTARKKAEEALLQSEKKYKTLTNNLQVGIYRNTTGPKGRFLEANPAIVKMFGYQSRADFFSINVADLYQNSYDRKKFIERIQETGFVKNKELLLKKKDGTPFIGSVTTVAVNDEKGEVKYYDGVMEDITERKKLEKQLQQAQKMEVIGTLAGGVAHDLNNILSGILSYPELLLMDLPEDSSLRQPLETIQESGKKSAAIVQDLLTLARRGVNTFEVLNLNDVVSEYLISPEFNKLKSYHPGAEIETCLEINLLNSIGSSVHLFKTVMNLISNAVEAMPDGGRVFLSTKNRYIDQPITGYDTFEEGDYVVLEVADTGIGISSQDISKIFEPFYTKKKMGRSGTGLGMAVVYGTVQDHKGYIEVQSKKGKGTVFTLYFPVTKKDIAKVDTNMPISDYKGDGQSILVIDDVKEQREIASSMLSQLGYAVNAVSSGEEAIKYMSDNTADLLVLDMIMDPGIDGLDTYKKILDLHPKQKVILASGYSETERVKKALNLGAGKYIKKPYTVKDISVAVMEELAGKGGELNLN